MLNVLSPKRRQVEVSAEDPLRNLHGKAGKVEWQLREEVFNSGREGYRGCGYRRKGVLGRGRMQHWARRVPRSGGLPPGRRGGLGPDAEKPLCVGGTLRTHPGPDPGGELGCEEVLW